MDGRVEIPFSCFSQATVRLVSCLLLILLANHTEHRVIRVESTAHALDATFLMLALHQDIQQEVYEEIRRGNSVSSVYLPSMFLAADSILV